MSLDWLARRPVARYFYAFVSDVRFILSVLPGLSLNRFTVALPCLPFVVVTVGRLTRRKVLYAKYRLPGHPPESARPADQK